MAKLPIELAKAREEIEAHARKAGLDFFPTIFELIEFDQMNEIAAFGGFPTRFRHWSFGMDFEQLAKGYEYGLSKIYEMVINNDPCYAYLLKSNPLVDQKLVMAHVYGHCDFFKNNAWFSATDRKMMDSIANHGIRIRRYIDRFGFERVESFIDICLSLDNLIDLHSRMVKRSFDLSDTYKREEAPDPETADQKYRPSVKKLRSKGYMDAFINPPDFMKDQRERMVEKFEKDEKFPASPVQDVLAFLIRYAPLEAWEQDILSIIRAEAYYFSPQAQTKIMNEGWASYWHSRLMTEKILKPSELIDYADHHSGTLATSPGSLNPYKLGIELFRNIEERWNKGKFGKEYEDCTSLAEKKAWDKKLGLGREKIFEVRKVYNDVTFLDEFLTPEFVLEQKLFAFEFNPKTGNYEIFSREFAVVKQKLLNALTNRGQPFIFVEDGNFENRSELLLRHRHEGIDLRIDWAQDTLVNLQKLWNRPVNLLTVLDGKEKILSYDGKEHREKSVETDAAAVPSDS